MTRATPLEKDSQMRKINAGQALDHMKRAVGKPERDAARCAIDELDAFMVRYRAEAVASILHASMLVDQGRTAEAQSFAAQEEARLLLRCSEAGARLEAAMVSYLGERRSAGETLEDYTGRIVWVTQDLSRVLEMQRRNGLEMKP
ncbi:MAG: hypothetical protein KGK18_10290 [Burkholderiales bacterium]|nr:hypothetical protein [Burkholderiales bacterium]